MTSREVHISAGSVRLEGEWCEPAGAVGLVLFAHSSSSECHSPQSKALAQALQNAGIGTLLFDLLTQEETLEDNRVGHLRYNISLLSQRLMAATRWAISQPQAEHFGLGYFGAGTGAAAALMAAAELGAVIDAVVVRGGRPELAREILPRITSPTLLIVGEYDDVVLQLNRVAWQRMHCEKELQVVPQATHLFEEQGALEEVAELASDWFHLHLKQM